ncbi:unnamed protein product [Effrenium voratum]|nr:unnamed protein product [Effrenium voratum]
MGCVHKPQVGLPRENPTIREGLGYILLCGLLAVFVLHMSRSQAVRHFRLERLAYFQSNSKDYGCMSTLPKHKKFQHCQTCGRVLLPPSLGCGAWQEQSSLLDVDHCQPSASLSLACSTCLV